jgi:hypothetical protein
VAGGAAAPPPPPPRRGGAPGAAAARAGGGLPDGQQQQRRLLCTAYCAYLVSAAVVATADKADHAAHACSLARDPRSQQLLLHLDCICPRWSLFPSVLRCSQHSEREAAARHCSTVLVQRQQQRLSHGRGHFADARRAVQIEQRGAAAHSGGIRGP